MAVDRSADFIAVGLFLSKFSEDGTNSRPPGELGTDSWKVAYAMFYDTLSAGRSHTSFRNSLKATRDQFDSHVASGRVGWRQKDGTPKPLPPRDDVVFGKLNQLGRAELWQRVQAFADLDVASVPTEVLNDLDSSTDEEDRTVDVGNEGRKRAVISVRAERSPALRAAALKMHGTTCQACGFNFGEFYGKWGEGFAEVHHIRMLADLGVDGQTTVVATDLAVLCANCHRMVHRRRSRTLTIEELRGMISRAQSA